MENSAKNNNNNKIKELPWPKIKWRMEFWLAFIPFVLGFILLFYPELPQTQDLRKTRNVIGITFILIPILAPFLFWFLHEVIIAIQRIYNYGTLYDFSHHELEEYDLFRKNVFDFLERLASRQAFEIIEAHFQDEKYYIILGKRSDVSLQNGDVIIVIHKEDSMVMGMFSVTDVHETRYYAVSIGGLDPVWQGFVREQVQATFFPHMYAIYLPQGEYK